MFWVAVEKMGNLRMYLCAEAPLHHRERQFLLLGAEPILSCGYGCDQARLASPALVVPRLDRCQGVTIILLKCAYFIKQIPNENIILVGNGCERLRLAAAGA